MGLLFDMTCDACQSDRHDVLLKRWDEPFACPACGAVMRKLPSLFATDVYGSEQTSRVLEGSWRSGRERDAKMKALGFEPAGDRVGGARNESHMGLGKLFSFKGQRHRGVSSFRDRSSETGK